MKRAIYILTILIISITFISKLNAAPKPVPKPNGTDANLVGHVLSNNKHVPYITIALKGTKLGTMTDASGHYRLINIPVGEYEVEARGVGYKAVVKKVTLTKGRTIELNFELEEQAFNMGAVVVTGTSVPTIYENVPVRTEIVPRKIIEQKQAVNLAEALSCQTGVRVENNCSNCNFTEVKLLGMAGKYSQILIDNDPVVSSLTGVYGLEQIPEEMVDQIEIIKGGGSSLYGGGAVAGVVNIITRRPMINRTKARFLANYIEGIPDQQVGFVSEHVSGDSKSGAFVFGSIRNRKEYDKNGDGFSELGMIKNQSVGINWYYTPVNSGELSGQFHHIHEKRRGGNKFSLPAHEANLAEALESSRWGGSVKWEQKLMDNMNYKVFYSFALQNRDSYYGGTMGGSDEEKENALNNYGTTKNPLHIAGASANYYLDNHQIVAGLEYKTDMLEDRSAANPLYYIDETYTNFGFFAQDIIDFFEKDLTLIIGARADKHSELNDMVISPRMSLKYNLGRGSMLRASASTGFKAPQVFDEDLHLCGLGGEQRITRNAPDLLEEKSYSFSAGYEYNGSIFGLPLLFGATGFYTEVTNAFAIMLIGNTSVAGQQAYLYHRINQGGATIAGAELDFGIKPHKDIEFRAGMTLKQSVFNEKHEDFADLDDEDGASSFYRSPDIYGNMRISYYISSDLFLMLSGNYTGEMFIPHETPGVTDDDPILLLEHTGDFFTLDLNASYKFKVTEEMSLKLNAGVRNITDEFQEDLDYGVWRDPGYVYGPGAPRTIYAGFELLF